MSVRIFKVGDICVHNGFICRVDAVERQITGQNVPSRAYMGIKDGTEFNPTLTMTPLFGPGGKPVKKPKTRKDASGAVEYAQDQATKWEEEAALLTEKADLIRSLK